MDHPTKSSFGPRIKLAESRYTPTPTSLSHESLPHFGFLPSSSSAFTFDFRFHLSSLFLLEERPGAASTITVEEQRGVERSSSFRHPGNLKAKTDMGYSFGLNGYRHSSTDICIIEVATFRPSDHLLPPLLRSCYSKQRTTNTNTMHKQHNTSEGEIAQ
ncbi:hypothetical protein LR48_Vigan04g146400 [Vigna angularis]|uniref:Uncharacterized protein n=2 Tax=Phaseolus angularis TaxID=3914 RepID=A0A0L9UEW1_PHAAN|nr:hypothetical protein LR48_Vigan04g146400 [Vigna angularis]BAT79291.1 hypothetical protein VIGAN_02215100 [Vigna angularis var. angularis]